MSKNPVVHFEMPYDDAERVSKFYQTAFGWQMNKTHPEMGGYVTAATAETDANRMVQTPGTINGGFFPKDATSPNVTSIVISVQDIQAAMKSVSDAGGKIVGDPMEIPGIGKYVACTDTEGNRVSLLQADPRMTK